MRITYGKYIAVIRLVGTKVDCSLFFCYKRPKVVLGNPWKSLYLCAVKFNKQDRLRLAWKAVWSTDRCTSAANVIRILWGKMLVFAWFPKGKWQLTDEKNGLLPLRIYTNRDVTISNHATNDTIYSVLRRVRAQRGTSSCFCMWRSASLLQGESMP